MTHQSLATKIRSNWIECKSNRFLVKTNTKSLKANKKQLNWIELDWITQHSIHSHELRTGILFPMTTNENNPICRTPSHVRPFCVFVSLMQRCGRTSFMIICNKRINNNRICHWKFPFFSFAMQTESVSWFTTGYRSDKSLLWCHFNMCARKLKSRLHGSWKYEQQRNSHTKNLYLLLGGGKQ